MVIKTFLNPEGHHNRIIVSKATVILLRSGFCLLVELYREGSAINGATPSSFFYYPALKRHLNLLTCADSGTNEFVFQKFKTNVYLFIYVYSFLLFSEEEEEGQHHQQTIIP